MPQNSQPHRRLSKGLHRCSYFLHNWMGIHRSAHVACAIHNFYTRKGVKWVKMKKIYPKGCKMGENKENIPERV
jgi:hypothetical protein